MNVDGQAIAVVTSDGILRCPVDITDEHTATFVKCVEDLIDTRLKEIQVMQECCDDLACGRFKQRMYNAVVTAN